jgi:hypothetical protein
VIVSAVQLSLSVSVYTILYTLLLSLLLHVHAYYESYTAHVLLLHALAVLVMPTAASPVYIVKQ